MNLEIKTRHFQLSDEGREKIEAQFEKVERFSPRPVTSLRLQIVRENTMFNCSAVLYLRTQEFRAENIGQQPEMATLGVTENLQRQLEKFKGKVSAKQRGEAGGLGVAAAGGEPVVHFATEDFVLHDMDSVSARDAFTDSNAPFLVYRNIDTGKIGVVYRRGDGDLGFLEASNS